jgi:four helix bundle protein
MQVNSFRDLKVWQQSMDLVEEVYGITKHLPKSESYGLVSQLQRASVSVPSNIAEGSKRSGRADFRKF